MTIKMTDPDSGEEKEYFTAEEVAAKDTEVANAKEVADKANADLTALQKIHSDQATNFKRYKDMSEEEKGALSAEKTELLKRIDETALIADKANATLADREKAENDAKRNSLVDKYTGGDKDLAAKFTEKFDSLATVTDMDERAKAAAVLAGIGVNTPMNPLHSSFGPGESPRFKQAQTEKDEFFQSDKGKAGIKIMEEK